MIQRARSTGDPNNVELSREENIDVMCEVLSDINLHLTACEGYKLPGTTNKLDGTEDHLIAREAEVFWRENVMRPRINAAVAEVKAEIDAGRLPWSYKNVQSLIGAYPRRGALDKIKEGQEDIAEEDPDGKDRPYEVDESVKDSKDVDGADGSRGDGAEDDKEEEECQDDSGSDQDNIPDFDPDDWVPGDWVIDPLKETPSGNNGDEQPEAQHGDGAGDAVHGDEATNRVDGPSLSMEEVSMVLVENDRMKTLENMRKTAADLHDSVGASLQNTLKKVIHEQRKRFTKRHSKNPEVLQSMRISAAKEEELAQKSRLQYRESLRQKRERTVIQHKLNEGKKKLAKLRKNETSIAAAQNIQDQMRRYSLEKLGLGHRNGGNATHKKSRKDVLSRLRGCGGLTAEQEAIFEWFIEEWDRVNADKYAEGWAKIFAEEMQDLTNKLVEGDTVAVSEFMHAESLRCLSDVPCLLVPGKLICS